jgi:hypothetical protein
MLRGSRLQPLSEVMTVEDWLDGSSYSQAEKDRLRRANEEFGESDSPGDLAKRFKRIRGIIKAEFYDAFKPPRVIGSRNDYAKIFFGPLIKSIEKKVYPLLCNPDGTSYFIKGKPVAEWAAHVLDHLVVNGAKYLTSDYKAFEGSFVPDLMAMCEYQLYRYMTRHLGTAKTKLFGKMIMSRCIYTFEEWKGMASTRCSGDVNTSLGNGFSNLCFALYACYLSGITPSRVRAMVEGDDGLFVLPFLPDLSPLRRLGLTMTWQMHDSINTASFCGMRFDPVTRTNLVDPRNKLLNTPYVLGPQNVGFGPRKKAAYLHAKALSLLVCHPICPIVTAYARCLIRLTPVSAGEEAWGLARMDSWHMSRLGHLSLPQSIEIPVSTRVLFSSMFSISVEEQIRWEKFFDAKADLRPYSIDLGFSDTQRRVFERYVVSLDSLELTREHCFHVDSRKFSAYSTWSGRRVR